jgi:FMN phosphatase YigB (HAD superfamily)
MEFDSEAARQQCARSDLVSFDVFDTALLRSLARPVDLFLAMEPAISGVIGREIPSFSRARQDAEAAAKVRCAREDQPLTLHRIYEQLRSAAGLTADQGEALGRLEIEMEGKFTFAHPLILRLWQHASDLGKRVVFLSDMYLPSPAIARILESHGYAAPEVFVSAEWGGNKASGKLFGMVRTHLGVAPGRCVHFGDNFYADVLRARQNGWRARHTAAANRRPDWERPPAAPSDGLLSTSVALGLSRGNVTRRAYPPSGRAAADFWDGFGYEVAGPIYFHYLHWLCVQAQRDGVRHLLLCARDGYPLVRGLEILKKAWSLPLEATYFFASRRLINLAAIRELTPDTVDFLLMPNPGLTLRDFVLRLNLDPVAQEPFLKSLGFTSIDERIAHDFFGRFLQPVYGIRLRRWLEHVREELLSRFATERALLQKYFVQAQVEASDAALVDIGWKATVAQAVQDVVRQGNPAFKLPAYFFGTYAGAERLMRSGGRVASFFLHLGAPIRRQRLVSVHEGLIELLFAAPHGSIVGLESGPNGIVPVHAACEYGPEQLVDLARMRDGANRFIEEAARLLPSPLTSAPSDAGVDRCLRQLLHHPTREQALHLGRMPYRVSYGESDSPRPFAAPGRQSYGQAPWKCGYLAQLSRPRRWLARAAHLAHGAGVALKSGTLLSSVKWALFRK